MKAYLSVSTATDMVSVISMNYHLPEFRDWTSVFLPLSNRALNSVMDVVFFTFCISNIKIKLQYHCRTDFIK